MESGVENPTRVVTAPAIPLPRNECAGNRRVLSARVVEPLFQIPENYVKSGFVEFGTVRNVNGSLDRVPSSVGIFLGFRKWSNHLLGGQDLLQGLFLGSPHRRNSGCRHGIRARDVQVFRLPLGLPSRSWAGQPEAVGRRFNRIGAGCLYPAGVVLRNVCAVPPAAKPALFDAVQ
jgi:hypothetical protein